MSENEAENQEDDPNLLTVEERISLYSRWFDVSLDIDRQLLTLSLACFGVLGTVLAGNVLKTNLHLVLWAISCFVFLIEIALLLVVVFLNKKLLETTLKSNRHQYMPWLNRCDNACRWVFFIALVCTAAFLGAVAFSQFKSPTTHNAEVLDEQRQRQAGTGIRWPIRNAQNECFEDKWSLWNASYECATTGATTSATDTAKTAATEEGLI